MSDMQVKYSRALAFFAGVISVAGFAPFFLFPLPVIALAVLFHLWQKAEGKWQAFGIGFFFGLGLFIIGIGWLYIALHDYGGMPMPLAALAIGLFAAFLALFPALAGYALVHLRDMAAGKPLIVLACFAPAIWALVEWLRGLLLTGFPWLSAGYSQVPYSPLAGYAPLLGVYGVSWVVALSAGLLAWAWQVRTRSVMKWAGSGLVLIWLAGYGLGAVYWTRAEGVPVKVSLLQGNIAQGMKFDENRLIESLETYLRLLRQSDAQLIVLPETAVPMLLENLPPFFEATLKQHALRNSGDVLVGLFEREDGQFYNSVVSMGSAELQRYRKNHLVPFGEFIPLRPVLGVLINEILHIPMGEQARGGDRQHVMRVAGQKVAVNICYEDVFGEEIIHYLPEATLLVNVTNDAWYGRSPAAMQHNQISQMRALETGRMMLRATNTGVTSVIDRQGYVLHSLPQQEEGMLTAMVQGYTGATPYVLAGNAVIAVLALLMLLVPVLVLRKINI